MTQDGVFTHPFMYWVGMETDPRTSPEALAEFNRFYSTTHVSEVVAAHPGFVRVSRYARIDPDPPGGVQAGPRWLAVYEMNDESAAEQYLKDNERPWLHRKRYSPWPPARRRAKIVWRMIWRQISTTESSGQTPESIVIVGTNVPADTNATNLAQGGFTRGTSFELYREFAHPAPGAPRFCAVYEVREAAGTLPSGPSPSEKQDTVWHLAYRLIPTPA